MNIDSDDLECMFQQARSFRTKHKEETKDINSCKSCKKQTLLDDFANGIIVCTACGVINDNQINILSASPATDRHILALYHRH